MSKEKELTVRVVVAIDERWSSVYDGDTRQEIQMTVPLSSLPGIVGAIDALVHGLTVETVATYLHKQAEKAEEKLSEEEKSND